MSRYKPTRIEVGSNYNPWEYDEEFKSAHKAIKGFTVVDGYRMYNLWSMVGQVSKLPEGVMVEVGVCQGGSGALMASRAKALGIPAPMYLCDTFNGLVKQSEKDSFHKDGTFNRPRSFVEEVTKKLDVVDYVTILEGIFPEDTAHLIKEDKIRFCHIDVDIYQSTKDVNEWIWPRLVVGGVVVYDDYGFIECDGVIECVNEQSSEPDRIVMYNLNGQAVVVKIK